MAVLHYDAIPAAFVAQLDWLLANGYTTILPGDLAARLGLREATAAEARDHHLRRRSRSWTKRVMPELRSAAWSPSST